MCVCMCRDCMMWLRVGYWEMKGFLDIWICVGGCVCGVSSEDVHVLYG